MKRLDELILPVPPGGLMEFAMARRSIAIEEAKSFPSGPSTAQQVPNLLTEFPASFGLDAPLSIRMKKPGKEFDRPGEDKNLLDMTPSVFRGEADLRVRPTFRKLYVPMEQMARQDPGGAEAVGALFVRAAYMIDHKEIAPGSWRYRPPEVALQFVESRTPELLGLPFRVALHLLDAIALNEDVKYVGTGRYELEDGVGRPNNLLTSAHAVAALMNRVSVAGFVGDLLQIPRMIAPIKAADVDSAFPVLTTGSIGGPG